MQPGDGVVMLKKAVDIYTDMGRLNMAARQLKEIAEAQEKQVGVRGPRPATAQLSPPAQPGGEAWGWGHGWFLQTSLQPPRYARSSVTPHCLPALPLPRCLVPMPGQGLKEEAMQFYTQAADLFATENSTSEATKCTIKVCWGCAARKGGGGGARGVPALLMTTGASMPPASVCCHCAHGCRRHHAQVAEFAAELDRFEEAVGIYEEAARAATENNLLKFSAKGYLLQASATGPWGTPRWTRWPCTSSRLLLRGSVSPVRLHCCVRGLGSPLPLHLLPSRADGACAPTLAGHAGRHLHHVLCV